MPRQAPADDFDATFQLMLEPVWFRVTARHHASINEWGDVDGRWSTLQVDRIPVVRHTPKGAWLHVGGDQPKFVLRTLEHRARAYAAPTLTEAREDFRKRKLYRISMLQGQISIAQREIDLLGDTDGLRLPP